MMDKIGAVKLNDFSYGALENFGHRKDAVLYIPKELSADAKDYWYEDYDFGTRQGDVVVVKILAQKRFSKVYGESYDGDETHYLLDIDGEKFVFNNGFSSWGDPHPSLEKAVRKEVYVCGPSFFELEE